MQEFGAACLRAPGRRRPFAPSRLLQPTGPRPPSSAVAPPPKTSDVRFLVGRSAWPPHMHHAAAPQMQARPRRASSPHTSNSRAVAPRSRLAALASSPPGCPRASGGRRIARTGPSPLVPRSTGPRCAPQSRGEIHPPAKKPAARMPSARSLPVECTGRTTRPGNTRPNAPHVAVPRGLATLRATGPTRVASPRGQCYAPSC